MSDIIERKKELRNQMKFLREGLTDDLLMKINLEVAERFLKLWKQQGLPDMLLAYMASFGEVPTKALLLQAFAQNLPVFLPKVLEKRSMCFIQVSSLHDLKPGAYGILEPEFTKEATVLATSEIANSFSLKPKQLFLLNEVTNIHMLVPGLAFDTNAYRLGYGGGFYDRYLSAPDTALHSIALAYDFQIVSKVPREAHDAKVKQMEVFRTM